MSASGNTTETAAVTELQWLERAVKHYHQRLLETPSAQDYLRTQGITAPEAVTAFRLGYADGTLEGILSAEGRDALSSVGVLTDRGRELMHGCITFPLVAPHNNEVVSLYGRHTLHHRHFYLPTTRRGIFNPQGARNTDEVILVETVVGAAIAWSLGFHNAIPTYSASRLTDEIAAHLEECRVRSAILLIEGKDVNRVAAEHIRVRLSEINISSRIVKIPARHITAYVTHGGTADDLRARMETPTSPASKASTGTAATPATTRRDQTPQDSPPLSAEVIAAMTGETMTVDENAPEGVLIFVMDDREYRIMGLSPVGFDRLRVNIRITVGNSFHLDTFDLYQARARAHFAEAAAKLCGVPEQQTSRDLLQLIERLEAVRLNMRRDKDGDKRKEPMSLTRQEAAMAFLRDPNLIERIVEDFRRCGIVGERTTLLTAYVAAISRKLQEPLGLLIVARSAAGKSTLQDALYSFVPPEEAVRVTRLTGQALFYKDPNSLRRKMLVIAEEEGAAQAVYSLRTLASDQRLSIAATRTDPQTGKLHTEHYEVFGPVVIVITTTSSEAFDDETRSRFVLLTMDESAEQTRLILERQRRRHTLEGVMERVESDEVQRLHHDAQRLLRPLEVVNPYADALSYPSERLIHRREQKKYLALINTIALLHQHQREIKRAVRGDVEVEYVEVTLEDIALANELATGVLSQALDELAPPVRGMYREIRSLCEKRAKEMKCSLRDVKLSRREIREATGWSDWQVRTYCQQLVELEYLYVTSGTNGKKYVYELAWEGQDEESPTLRGLVDVEQLKRHLSERRGYANAGQS